MKSYLEGSRRQEQNNSLTCFRSTVHSSFVHIHRCSHGMSWACAHMWRHAHMGSSYIHQHSLSQSTLGRQGKKITATIVIYDLHVSKRLSVLSLYTNNTSLIISRFPLRYCQKWSTLFPLRQNDSKPFFLTVCYHTWGTLVPLVPSFIFRACATNSFVFSCCMYGR